MRFMTMVHGLFLGGICVVCLACAKQTPAPQNPASVEQAPAGTEASTAAPSDADQPSGSTAHGMDVGMEFKDKDDAEFRRANHDTPPTSSWKPVGKDKSIDSKDSKDSKSEPGKTSVTAAR